MDKPWRYAAAVILAAAAASSAVVVSPWLALAGLVTLALIVAAWTLPRATFCALLLARFLSDYLNDPRTLTASPSTQAVTAATVLFAAVMLVSQRNILSRLPGAPLLAFGGLILWVAVRSLTPESADQGLRETAQWVTYLLVFMVGALLFGDDSGVKSLARLIVVGALFQCALATFQFATGQVPEYAAGGAVYLRPYGSFPHPGWLAFFLALSLFALPAVKWARRRTLAAGAVILLFLGLTFARGSLVFVFVAAVIYGILSRRSRVLAFAACGVVGAFLIPAVRNRFLGEITDGTTTGSYLAREMLRNYALDLWKQQPLIGHGTGSFFGTFSKRFGGTIEAHSDIIKLMADQGLIGLALYLLMIVVVILPLVRSRRPELLAVAAFLVTLPLMGVLDVFYRMTTGQVMLWALAGAAVAAASPRGDGRSGEVVGDDLRGGGLLVVEPAGGVVGGAHDR